MKLLIFSVLVIIGTVLGGLYGSLHNQISYTIAPEFFTKVRFGQFNMSLSAGRFGAALIGWKNTWKTGLGLTLVISFVGLIHPTYRMMLLHSIRAIFINILIAFLFGMIGLITGLYVNEDLLGLNVPEAISDKHSFVAVEQMHNFSYIGGLIGLGIAIIWQLFSLREYSKNKNQNKITY